MRVLAVGNMYPPQHLGGYELTWLSSTRDLLAAGHEVRILTTHVRLSEATGEEHDGVYRELHWYWKDHGWPPQTLRSRVRIERHNAAVLRRHIGELKPDAVAFWAMGGMSLGLIEQVRRAALPAVGVVGDDWMVYGPEVDSWTRMHARRPWLRPLAAFLGLPSRFDPGPAAVWLFNSATTRWRAEESGLTLPRAEVVHPGVEHDLFPPSPRREWSGRLLCLGRIDPRKGIATAISALAELPGYTLSIRGAGDHAHERDLRAQAAREGVAERVSFEEVPRHQVARTYAEHDALLFPVTWIEPWGLVPLEAMAVGLPVIATDAGGPAEYLEHERNALVLPRDAPASEFAAAVRRLEADPAMRERLVTGGRETAARFSADAYDRAIREALEAAVGG